MTPADDLKERIEAIEACYEYMLAYAAQGVLDDRTSRGGSQLRELLAKAARAASGLGEACAAAAASLEPAERYRDFRDLLTADAAKALAAMELVLAQPRISSQLVDNLNASLHVRTLLTDVYLLDEVLRIHEPAAEA
ncbi:hypothetical protein [Solidesulfovibrio sp.]|uniref:hypothetical protein n=1 Tax=Solidesulfovibrio sp. TaxID=2910990 RepID=UPI00263166B9|nr:hypothetical protein [Solidesulfovibrio sp.]